MNDTTKRSGCLFIGYMVVCSCLTVSNSRVVILQHTGNTLLVNNSFLFFFFKHKFLNKTNDWEIVFILISNWLRSNCSLTQLHLLKIFFNSKVKTTPQTTAMRWHLYWGENGNLNINVIIGLWKHFLFPPILTLYFIKFFWQYSAAFFL